MSVPEPAARAVVAGAGGHAKVVIELIRAAHPEVEIVGLVDADATPRTVLGLPVIGDDSALAGLRGQGLAWAFPALGDNAAREALAARLARAGFGLLQAISPAAMVSPSARLGAGIAIMAGAVINAETVVEDLAIINTGALVDHDCRIGQAAHVAPGCVVTGTVTVGDRAFLGAGVSVIPGISIGADAVVGAGACVTNDIPPAVVAVGVPARVLRPAPTRSAP